MPDVEHALHTFMAQLSGEMASEYERIFSKSAEDPGTAGDEGEENWAVLLRDWLPPNYHVATKGRLIAPDGRMSPQIDVLVLKPFYPKKLREKKVWLADGVVAAFECKTTLRSEHIREAGERCKKFKSLFAWRSGSPEKELRSSLIYGMLAHSHAWKAPGSKPEKNVYGAIDEVMDSIAHPSEMIDLICLADVGTWYGALETYADTVHRSETDRMKLMAIYQGNWGVLNFMMGAVHSRTQVESFRPIGLAIAYITQRLAWNDPSIRDLADYYRYVSLFGTAYGKSRGWPQNIYSNEVRSRLERRDIEDHGPWSGWDRVLF